MQNTAMFLIFISLVITVYSLLNYYFIKKHNNILTRKSLPLLLLRLVIFTIILTPIATIFFSLKDIPIPAAITGFTGYSWLAFLFLFLIIHGTVDIVLFVIEKAGFKAKRHLAKEIFAITMIISLSVLIYGYFEAKDIQIERLTIETSKLPRDVKSIRIVQISDVHFSPLISVCTAKKISNLVQKENPDIIISTGDLLDRAIRNSKEVSKVLRKMKAPLGKFAITGNHEFITEIKYSLDFIKDSGFTIIRNDIVTIQDAINLVGVDDHTALRYNIPIDKSESDVLKNADTTKYTILLKHQPKIEDDTAKYFDLMLSGHTHAGQIFPWTLAVRIAFPYFSGLYEVDSTTKLYVNRGTGTWGPPVRFLATPEITVIDIKNKVQ